MTDATLETLTGTQTVDLPVTATAATMDSTRALQPGAPVTSSVQRGTVIGRYVVLSKLGAGAMGEVFAAHDPELDRKVALKMLTGDQSSARVRLQREAQALAKLDHRNVVSVHDVGAHAGQLFVAMELVKGQTLAAWMRSVTEPRPWREVLGVFLEAGRGLAAAHGAGLIHRDFKPDNVMLGDDQRVRVMDFGLARAASDSFEPSELEPSIEQLTVVSGKTLLLSPLTQAGSLLGTPAYMSPEQLRGQHVDALSDQFGFCVALYEGLYGERPFAAQAQTLKELVDAVTLGELAQTPPGSTVPTWLRKVVTRGLCVAPSQRFGSMQALLDALADDPAVRRRKWWAGAGLVALVALLAVGLGLTLAPPEHAAKAEICVGMEDKLAGVWDEARHAEVEASILATKLSYAPGTWERVEQHMDAYTHAWVVARTEACVATHRGEQSGELLDARMACLDGRLVHVHNTVDVLAHADVTVVNEAVHAIASLPSLERCADLEVLKARHPPPEDEVAAARVAGLEQQLARAEALEKSGQYEAGLRVASAAVIEAETIEYEPLRAWAWLRQGVLQKHSGDYEAAERSLEQAYKLALGQRMVTEAASASLELVEVVGVELARYEDGQRWALVDAEPTSRAARTDEARARYFDGVGVLARKQGHYEEARGHHEQALVLWERAAGPDSLQISSTLNHLGNTVYREGNYEQAREHYQRSLQVREQALGPEHPHVGASLNNLGMVALQLGRLDEARELHERALTIRVAALGPDHPTVAASLNNLGITAMDQGDHAEARDYYERSLAIKYKTLGPDHPDTATSLDNLGSVASSQGEYEEARGYHERALAINEKALGPDHIGVAFALNNLGLMDNELGNYDQALARLQRSLAIKEQAQGLDHPGVASTLTNLAHALLGQGHPAEALPHLERALSIRSSNEVDPAELATTRFELARALWDAPAGAGRDRERASVLAEQALAAYELAGERAELERRELEAWLATIGLGPTRHG